MKTLLFLAALLLSPAAAAQSPYKTENLMLLQPQSVLEARVPSVQALSDYIKAVQATAEGTLQNETPSPASGFIAIAVRPGAQSRVWLDFKPALPKTTSTRLAQAIQAVPPFAAKEGTVVFAIHSTLWGAKPKMAFPNPPEWSAAMEESDQPIEIGELIDRRVWPAESTGASPPDPTSQDR